MVGADTEEKLRKLPCERGGRHDLSNVQEVDSADHWSRFFEENPSGVIAL